MLLQPPLLVICSKTSLAEFLGARTQRGIMMAKKPAMCKTKARVSNAGRARLHTVLNGTVRNPRAIIKSEACQFSRIKSAL